MHVQELKALGIDLSKEIEKQQKEPPKKPIEDLV